MDDLYKTKQSRCRFAHISFERLSDKKISYDCIKNGMSNGSIIKNIDEAECENCPHFKSRFIEYPITVNKIDVKPFDVNDTLRQYDIGKLVKIRPCDEKYNNKTFLGIFLGELPQSSFVSYDSTSGEIKVSPLYNPAIYVPELKKIIFGCESWWGFINDEEELNAITDDTIANQWYVRMAKEMFGGTADDN